MTRSRTLAIAGLTMGLLAGGGVGATLGLPSVVGAQSTAAAASTTSNDPAARLRTTLQPLVDRGAITAVQLDAVITALEAARPTQAARPGAGRRVPPQAGVSLEVVAPLLGSTPRDVVAALRSGTSIAAQAEAAGVPLATIVDALVAELAQRLTAQVDAGRLTKERADQMIAQAPERLTAQLERVASPVGRGHRGHLTPMRGAATPRS